MCVLIPVKGIRGLIERTNLHCTRAAQDCLGNACVYGFSQLTQTVNEDFGCPVFIGRNTFSFNGVYTPDIRSPNSIAIK